MVNGQKASMVSSSRWSSGVKLCPEQDVYKRQLEEFVNTIIDMGIWIYSLEVGPAPITVSHAEDFGC